MANNHNGNLARTTIEEDYCNEKKKPWPFDPIRFARIQQNEINYTSPRVVTGGVVILASERTSWQSFGALLAYVHVDEWQ
jgi:hypothetical protein